MCEIPIPIRSQHIRDRVRDLQELINAAIEQDDWNSDFKSKLYDTLVTVIRIQERL
jgi:hypothetical protein